MPLASRGEIARVILQVLGLTRLSGKSGHILPQGRPCASRMMQCAHRRSCCSKWMIRERVTIAFVPTVHATPMMAMEWPATTALRLLLTGGDVLHHAPAVQLPFDVVNNYGPTECTVVATSAVLKPGSHGAPPIGRPIAGTSVYLLNEHGEPGSRWQFWRDLHRRRRCRARLSQSA